MPTFGLLLLVVGFAFGLSPLGAADKPGLPLARPSIRTNPPAAGPAVRSATNSAAKSATGTPKTYAPSAAHPATNPWWPRLRDTARRLPSNQAFYPALVALALAGLLLVKFFQSKSGKPSQARGFSPGPRRQAAIQRCNVLQASAQGRQLWGFEAHNGSFRLDRSQLSLAGEPLPAGLISKSWRALWQPKLNIAWLPPESVFLRVAQFPESDFKETLAMVELQLEKLSPMPVNQIVWSIHVLPQPHDKLQTVIVAIVARNVVEEFLGQLEGQGYLADRIELPVLDQLRDSEKCADGAWIYPEVSGTTNTALVAWRDGGVLRNLDLVNLPATQREAGVKEQLLQTAWAGELEGWLTAAPRWHLVADAAAAADWEPALRMGLEQPVEVVAPLAPAELAALTAQRAAHSEPGGDLLPPEYSTRYKEQFYDRLWMRGLLALAGLYGAGVLCYLGAVQYLAFRARSVESEWAALSNTYTNAIQLKARFQVLKERQELKFAALDSYKAVAETMPESLTLNGWTLSDGRRLSLDGTAPRDQAKDVLDFDAALRKTTINGQPGQLLFDPNKGDHATYQQSPAGLSWRLSLELKRTEVE